MNGDLNGMGSDIDSHYAIRNAALLCEPLEDQCSRYDIDLSNLGQPQSLTAEFCWNHRKREKLAYQTCTDRIAYPDRHDELPWLRHERAGRDADY